MFTIYIAVESVVIDYQKKPFNSPNHRFDPNQSLDYDDITKSSDFSSSDRDNVNKHIDEIQKFINYFKEAIKKEKINIISNMAIYIRGIHSHIYEIHK